VSEFRYCKLTKEWTLFAPQRLKRPIEHTHQASIAKGALNCPFDPGKEHYTPEEITRIEQKGEWQCRVIPNLYHALSIDEPQQSQRESFFEKFSGFGAHEILIETPHHDKQMWAYDYNDFVNYLTIMQERTVNLKKDTRLAHLSIFKNQGQRAGASLSHAHTQLIALPFIPENLTLSIQDKKDYYAAHKRALLDDLVYEELQYGKNIIVQNSDFIAYCPYASKHAFEVKIVAKKRLASLIEFSANDIAALSDLLKDFFKKFHDALGDSAFNMLIKNAPYDGYTKETANYFRFSIEIIPRIYNIAGFELDSQIHINVVLPEIAAQTYKEKS